MILITEKSCIMERISYYSVICDILLSTQKTSGNLSNIYIYIYIGSAKINII